MANDLRKFSNGAQVHIIGTPRASLGRTLLVLATMGGALAPGVATASNVTVHDTLGSTQIRVVDSAVRAVPVRGASLATPRFRTAQVDPVKDTGGDMARNLMQMMGGQADDVPDTEPMPQARVPMAAPTRMDAPGTYTREIRRSPDVDTPDGRPAEPEIDETQVQDDAIGSRHYEINGKEFTVTGVGQLQARAPISVIAPGNHVFKEMPDAEIGADGQRLEGVALRAGEKSPAERFNAPYSVGQPMPVAPKSRFGVEYTWSPLLHEHRNARQELEIIEGGFTSHKGVVGTYLPEIPDPSDAFMNIGVLAISANAGTEYDPSVHMMEGALAKAKDCVRQFGLRHDCSTTVAGVTFDYGRAVFSIRVRPKGDMTGREMSSSYGKLVVQETQDGLYPGPAFRHVMTAEPEVGMTANVPR